MREMKVIDVDGADLIIADGDGEEFRVTVDETSLRRLRHGRISDEGPRVSPKEIQSHLRSGLSTEEITALTGATADYIQRFESPVLAEREYILNSAFAVATQDSVMTDTGSVTSSFGTVIAQRLTTFNATPHRWATWKEESGSWIIKLEFTARDIEHDARWSFDSRKKTLTPVNSDAATLSQKGELETGLIPKLRAVGTDSVAPVVAETFTQDSPQGIAQPDVNTDTREHSPTADLLEALRKRRNERESTPAWLREEVSSVADSGSDTSVDDTIIGGVTVELDATIDFTQPFIEPNDAVEESAQDSKPVTRPHRSSMPSWDDIVFGTRSDDDPA